VNRNYLFPLETLSLKKSS